MSHLRRIDMSKKARTKRFEVSTLIIWLIVILSFGSVGTMVTTALIRNAHQKEYTRECGYVIGGNVEVYAEYGDSKVLLNDSNRMALAKICASGNIYFERSSDILTGKTILFTSVTKDEDKYERTLLVEELSDGKTRVTATTENGSITSSLNDIKFSAFIRLIGEKSANGENTVIY